MEKNHLFISKFVEILSKYLIKDVLLSCKTFEIKKYI